MATSEAVGQTVSGMLVPYGRWEEINSPVEGRFMERWAYGSLRSSFAERMKTKIRGYFEHGKSALFGRQAVMDVRRVWEEASGAWYEAELLDGLPPYLVDGIRRGLYGTSIGASPVKVDTVSRPGRSAHNPHGLEERTYIEAVAHDISLTPRPVYAGTEVSLRSRAEPEHGETIWRSSPSPVVVTPSWWLEAPAPRDYLADIDYFADPLPELL
jgi:phage head maturation protease